VARYESFVGRPEFPGRTTISNTVRLIPLTRVFFRQFTQPLGPARMNAKKACEPQRHRSWQTWKDVAEDLRKI
jgi:hypothetical protein